MSEDCPCGGGSGCVVCKKEPELGRSTIQEPVKQKLFHSREVARMIFSNTGDCEKMVNYLNAKCSLNQLCPLLRQMCDTSCPSFLCAKIFDRKSVRDPINDKGISEAQRFAIKGFRCDCPMLVRDK
ncbi:hypothetical protein KA005_26345 [bacterium]|nr:hypothetical protein [bacterium]